ncbi:MAG: sodium transporter, partial [Nitrospirae bacterium]
MTFMMLNLGVPISIGITCFVFIPYIRNSGVESAYELLEKRFDLKVRLLSAIIYSLHLLLRTGVLILGPAIVFSGIIGIDIEYAILLIGLIATLYTVMGGIRAVVWTDVLQFLVLSAGAVITLIYCIKGVGFSEIMRVGHEANKFKWFDGSLDLTSPRNVWSAGIAYIVLD